MKCPHCGAEIKNGSEFTLDGGASAEVVELIPLIGGKDYPVSKTEVAEFERLFPAVDIPQTLREMRAWVMAKPKRRKTTRGVGAFMVGWFMKEQDRHGR